MTSPYRVHRAGESQPGVWMNYCEQCAARMYVGFMPSEAVGKEILLHEVREPFEARVGKVVFTRLESSRTHR